MYVPLVQVHTVLYTIYPIFASAWPNGFRSSACMQDTFARATHSAVGQARRATIGYLVHKPSARARKSILYRKEKISCIQVKYR